MIRKGSVIGVKEADARIPQAILDEIISRLSIVDVIGRYVPLKKSGANYMGLCPFHNERTPSFSVSPSKQIYHCFGCGAGGNLFRFVMDTEHLSFPEAARKLAKEAGVTIPERVRSPEEQKQWELRQRNLRWNQMAATFYAHQLDTAHGKRFRSYLHERNISEDTIKRFALGCCTNRWDSLFQFLRSKGASPDELVQLGLVSKSTKGTGYYDRFRDRLMFPIRNAGGQVIGFGGRIINDGSAPQKYLNSPETPLFHKSSVVYGLDLAKQAIRKRDQVLIVEGYMDVIACHQAGISHAVAPMGTALTPEQVKLLLRYTYRFVTAFDGDEAGKRATLKSLELIENVGGMPTVMIFPNDSDPDAFLQTEGQAAFENLLKNAVEGLAFRIQAAVQNQSVESIEGKMTVLEGILPVLARQRNHAKLEHGIQKVAEALNLSAQAVSDELVYFKRSGKRHRNNVTPDTVKTVEETVQPVPVTQAFRREATLLNCLLADADNFAEVEARGGDSLFVTPVATLYRICVAHYRANGVARSGDVPAEWSQLLAQVLSEAEENERKEEQVALFYKVLNQVEWHHLNQRYQAKLEELSLLEKTDPSGLEQALLDMGDILKEKTRLERDMRKEQ